MNKVSEQINRAETETVVPLASKSRDPAPGFAPGNRADAGELSDAQWTIVNLCVRAAQALGAPRSYGEIFGFIFCSSRPICFEDVVRVLKLSSGTASQGLRQLKRYGVVRTCYRAQDRRDHYVAETSLHKVISSYFAEAIFAHLGNNEQQLTDLRSVIAGDDHAPGILREVDLLLDWSRQLRRATHAAAAAMA